MRVHVSALLPVCLAVAACGGGGGGSDTTAAAPGPYELIFTLDASYQTLHAGQPIQMALVRTVDGAVLAEKSGTVSATGDPSFLFAAGAVMQRGVAYAVHYWIDSNIGGGLSGNCDHKAFDHQWSVEFPTPTNDVNFVSSHNPTLTEDVCATFS